MTRAVIQSRDHGAAALLQVIGELAGGQQVSVGVHQEQGAAAHRGGDGMSVADVLMVHERGTSTIPRRSALEDTITIFASDVRGFAANVYRRVLKQEMEPAQALNRFGLFVVGLIQRRIARGISPPNAPSTIRQKKSSKPLVNLGQLRAAFSHKVRAPGERIRRAA